MLEQVSSAEHIGSMTEVLLKVLDEDGVVAKVTCMCALASHTECAPVWCAVQSMLFRQGGDSSSPPLRSWCSVQHVCWSSSTVCMCTVYCVCSVYSMSLPPPPLQVLD